MDTSQSALVLKIFLVEDAPVVRSKMVMLIGAIAGVVIVGEAEDSDTALAGIRACKADVAIVDLRLAAGNGIDLIATLSRSDPQVVKIALTNHSGAAFRSACKTAGAEFFFDKTAEFDAACRTIETLAATRRTGVIE